MYNELYLDIVAHVKENVEESIKRLGDNGMKIHNLVIPKPKIPEDIKANYQAVKVQSTKQLVATQEQKTQKILKETKQCISYAVLMKCFRCMRLMTFDSATKMPATGLHMGLGLYHLPVYPDNPQRVEH